VPSAIRKGIEAAKKNLRRVHLLDNTIPHQVLGRFGAGMVMLTWWLLAAAAGQNAYGTFEGFASSWIGRVILFGFSWALLHHLIGGLRYLVWDLGYGLEPAEREWLVRANIIGSIAAVILLWLILAMFGMR